MQNPSIIPVSYTHLVRAPLALGVAHVLSCRLRFTVKILYELCFLDVYKRQDRYSTQLKLYADALGRIFSTDGKSIQADERLIYSFRLQQTIAVSYTHLDVYKRQVLLLRATQTRLLRF